MKKIYFLLFSLLTKFTAFGQAGEADRSFTCGSPNFYYTYSDVQSDGKLLVGRGILQPGGTSGQTEHTLVRFLSNGAVDNSFSVIQATGRYDETLYDRIGILDVKVLPDDRILVAGVFGIRNQGQPASPNGNLARLLPNGDIDPTFNYYNDAGVGFDAVTTIFINNAGELIVGGHWVFSRILDDGSIDLSFGSEGAFAFTTVETIDQFSNGKYLVGGILPNYGPNLMRMLPNGLIDPSWNIGTGFNGKVQKVLIQPDQKILVIGNFTQFNGSPAKKVCRLNEDGTLDTTFNIGTGPTSGGYILDLRDIILQPDGKIILGGGELYSFNGFTRKGIVRLNTDGSVDTSFGGAGIISMNGDAYPGKVESILQLPDSKIVVAGYLSNYKYHNTSIPRHTSFGVMRLLSCTNSTETQTINACESYTWIDGNTYTESNNTATHTYTSSEGCSITATLDLTITPAVTITNLDNTLNASLPDATYQWVDCSTGNAPISGETNQSFTPTEAGNYAVEVTLNGCTSTSACIPITTLGVSAFEKGDFITMYPNPSDNIVNIKTVDSIAFMSVYDLLGKLIIYKNTDLATIDISQLSKGFYIVKFNLENGKTISKRLSKL